MAETTKIPILIVGAGPTGLALALALRRCGIQIRLIDRLTAPAAVSKALAIWSGSLEGMAGLDAVAPFLAAGVRLKSIHVGDGSHQLATFSVGEGIDSPYPYPLLLPQSRTEAILTAEIAKYGSEVERGVELSAFTQDDAGVTATLRHANGDTEELSALYLVGTDGARSTVRHGLGVEFEGYTEPQTFLLGDIRIDGALERQSIYIWWHQGGTLALFPFETDTWRVICVRESDNGEAPPTLAELQTLVDRHGPSGLTLRDPTWLSAFRTNERLAARYRVGRVLLAGDAAHIHSPAGGQGMNTGLQDSLNLGWKLAHVLQGRGDPELLLESYEAERRPVARTVVAGAAQKLHFAFAKGAMARLARDAAATIVGHVPAAQKLLQVDLSETEITYRDGPLVELGATARHPRRGDVGTRAQDADFIDPATGKATSLWPLFDGRRHTLLVFENVGERFDFDCVADDGAELHILRFDARNDPEGSVAARYHMRAPSFALIRPDQVVALRGTADDLSELEKYLDRVARLHV